MIISRVIGPDGGTNAECILSIEIFIYKLSFSMRFPQPPGRLFQRPPCPSLKKFEGPLAPQTRQSLRTPLSTIPPRNGVMFVAGDSVRAEFRFV